MSSGCIELAAIVYEFIKLTLESRNYLVIDHIDQIGIFGKPQVCPEHLRLTSMALHYRQRTQNMFCHREMLTKQ